MIAIMNNKTPLSTQSLIEVKNLRPWVKYGMGGILGFGAYLLVTGYLYQPKPYTVQFDLKRIQDFKEGKHLINNSSK